MLEPHPVIRRLGSHAGKRICFGYDRYLAPELAVYRELLGVYGQVIDTVDHTRLHYLTSAELSCRAMQNDEDSFGVLVCGTGMGMSIAANKFSGVYAARCTTVDDAELSRRINNANVLCLAANAGFELNRAIIEVFATTEYTGRKLEELEYITHFERPAEPVSKSRSLRRTA
ncbi:MAG: rpiB [Myxococcales bacterium]|nr:rpiB [Myxococcales bacterium]